VSQLGIGRLVAEREEPLLGTVEREGDVGRLVVRVRRDRSGRPEEAPQDGSVADDAAIAVDLGRRGYALGERAEVRLATRPVELLTIRSRRSRSAWAAS